MDQQEFYQQIKSRFETSFTFLSDKPEETMDSTIRACWQTAAGMPMSAEEALKVPLPQLNKKQEDLLLQLISQRLENKPLAHITGRQNFMGIELLCDERALIPRKETEILGRKALELSRELAIGKETINVMDICCGSGNLGATVAKLNSKVHIQAADLSEEAVALARENVAFLHLEDRMSVVPSDLFKAFDQEDQYGKTELIICNPPYISSAKVSKMDGEISGHEPSLAFDGGMFGTKIIVKLISEAPKFLVRGGWLIFEVGLGQGPFVLQLCERSDHYTSIDSLTDAQGNIRVIQVRKK